MLAASTAARLREIVQVGGHLLRVLPVSFRELESVEDVRTAALFIVSSGIPSWVSESWGQQHQAMVSSPFAGDVERGAAVGVFVSDRILPFVNLDSARRAGIRFKAFFLRVAQHESGKTRETGQSPRRGRRPEKRNRDPANLQSIETEINRGIW